MRSVLVWKSALNAKSHLSSRMDDALLANRARSLTQPIRNVNPVHKTALNAKAVIPAKSVKTTRFSTNLKKYALVHKKKFCWRVSAKHALNTAPLVRTQGNAQHAIDPISLRRGACANSHARKVICLMSL